MADPVQGEPFQGREPYRENPPEPRVYSMGDHGPFPGQAPTRPDDDIKRDVDTALFYDDAVSSLGVDVSVEGGVVTMTGAVNSDLAKRLAGEDAWKVGGVRDVKNDLAVHESPTPSRAAGQDVISTKPPDSINGEPPPATKQASQGQPSQPSGQQSGTSQGQQGQ